MESGGPAILLALLLDVWLGGFFAFCARARIRQGGPWAQPSVSLVGTFVAVILAPMTAYLALAHADWWWLYLIDPDRVPRLVVVPMVAAGAAALFTGYWGAARMLALVPDRRALPGALGGLAAILLLLGFLARGRLLHDGSYSEFHGGRALPLFDVKLGYALVAVAVGLASAVAFVAFEISRDGRKAQSR